MKLIPLFCLLVLPLLGRLFLRRQPHYQSIIQLQSSQNQQSENQHPDTVFSNQSFQKEIMIEQTQDGSIEEELQDQTQISLDAQQLEILENQNDDGEIDIQDQPPAQDQIQNSTNNENQQESVDESVDESQKNKQNGDLIQGNLNEKHSVNNDQNEVAKDIQKKGKHFEKKQFVGTMSEPLETDDSFLLENDETQDEEIFLPEWSSASNNNIQLDEDLEIGFNVGEDY